MSDRNLWQEIAFAFKSYFPGMFYAEKKQRLEERSAYRIARQREIAIGQEFVHRGRFRGNAAMLCIATCVIIWCGLFVLGSHISTTPFQLLMNIVSASTTDSTASNFVGPLPLRTFEHMRKHSSNVPSIQSDDLQTANTQSPTGPNSAANVSKNPSVDVDRVTNYIQYIIGKRQSELWYLLAAFVACIFTSIHSNMLILSCIAAIVGSLCNYAVQALKQAREFSAGSIQSAEARAGGIDTSMKSSPISPSIFGHRRVFTSFSATVVVGLGLGFAAFLICTAGLLLVPSIMKGESPQSYHIAVSTTSLIAFVVALLPDRALLFIETRVNDATRMAVAARSQRREAIRGDSSPIEVDSDAGQGARLEIIVRPINLGGIKPNPPANNP